MAEWTETLQVFCADIGSIAGDKFAWARRQVDNDDEEVRAPASIESLAGAVVYQLERQQPVALGFEMPLFVPVPTDPAQLGKSRPCDRGAPAWSSNVGASVMATGIVQSAWILRLVHDRLPETELHLRWEPFAEARMGLLIWEAFVTKEAKGKTHEEDATIGLDAFCAQLPTPGDPNGDDTEQPLSLAAAAALWAGWDLPPEALRS